MNPAGMKLGSVPTRGRHAAQRRARYLTPSSPGTCLADSPVSASLSTSSGISILRPQECHLRVAQVPLQQAPLAASTTLTQVRDRPGSRSSPQCVWRTIPAHMGPWSESCCLLPHAPSQPHGDTEQGAGLLVCLSGHIGSALRLCGSSPIPPLVSTFPGLTFPFLPTFPPAPISTCPPAAPLRSQASLWSTLLSGAVWGQRMESDPTIPQSDIRLLLSLPYSCPRPH